MIVRSYLLEKGLAPPRSCEGEPAPVLTLAELAAPLTVDLEGGFPNGDRAALAG